jgi:hypothetical protein
MAAARKTVEEQLADVRKKQAEMVKQVQLRNREKIKILNKRLAKIETERVTDAGKAFKKLYKEHKATLELKDFLAICEKFWPARKETKQPAASAGRMTTASE